MSDTTDDMDAMAGVMESQLESFEDMMEKPVWRTRAGEYMKIRDMETSHIQNCIRMLERKLTSRPVEQVYIGDSDYAEDAVESENRHNEWLTELFSEKIKQFKHELLIRQPPNQSSGGSNG